MFKISLNSIAFYLNLKGFFLGFFQKKALCSKNFKMEPLSRERSAFSRQEHRKKNFLILFTCFSLTDSLSKNDLSSLRDILFTHIFFSYCRIIFIYVIIAMLTTFDILIIANQNAIPTMISQSNQFISNKKIYLTERKKLTCEVFTKI